MWDPVQRRSLGPVVVVRPALLKASWTVLWTVLWTNEASLSHQPKDETQGSIDVSHLLVAETADDLT